MAKPSGYFKRPPGPRAGLWSWQYLDLWKTFRMVNSERVRGFYEAFPAVLPVGSEFPDLELTTTEGEALRTGDLEGEKHLVLFTGAIT